MTASRILCALTTAVALSSLGCISINLPSGQISPLVETTLGDGVDSGPKILLIEVDGVIQETPESPGLFGFTQEGMVGRLREELDLARKDDQIRALLLRINSPGGTVTGSDLLYQEIQRFKKQSGVPVVAQLMGIAASGGYYVAQAADAIYAQPTTVTGSIGVIMTGVNLTGLMEKLGVADQTLATGAFKDSGSMLRPMRETERVQLQSVLDDLFGRFLEVVQRGRPELSAEQIRTLADGRVYSAKQALDAGLIDAIGSFEEATADARKRADLRTARVVTYHRPREHAANYYTRTPLPPGLRTPPSWLESLGIQAPAFLYLWAPGAAP